MSPLPATAQDREQRDAYILDLHAKGLSHNEIARVVVLTPQRVQQIIARAKAARQTPT